MDMYGVEASTATISRVTDKILPLIQEWRSRPLERVYLFVWLDAIHYKVRHEGRVISRAVYCIIGLNQEGYKELLGMYIGENEGAKFWLQVLTDLQNRGLEHMFIACIDNLQGFADAIESIFPQTEVQLCIVHQIRKNGKTIRYNYDAGGNRIRKDVGGVYTWYVRSATGDVMSVYTQNDATVNNNHLSLIETNLYGSTRLGMSTETIDLEAQAPNDQYLSGNILAKDVIFSRGKKLF